MIIKIILKDIYWPEVHCCWILMQWVSQNIVKQSINLKVKKFILGSRILYEIVIYNN